MILLLTHLAYATCPQTLYAPTESFGDARGEVSPELSSQLDTLLFPERLPDRAGIRTDQLAIFHQGALIYERAAAGYTPESKHLYWSASKSFTAVLAGIAEHRGLLDPTLSVCEYVETESADTCQVTVHQLMEFSSGIAWRETYEGESPTASAVLAMLYGAGRYDMSRFVGSLNLQDPPGSTYQYSSGDTNLLSAVVRSVLEPHFGRDYAWTLLFDPIGIESATWERDASGTPVGSSYLYLTPHDAARFGHLLLNDGCWEGPGGATERHIPEGWLTAATTLNPAAAGGSNRERGPGENQGRQFWVNWANPSVGEGPRWSDVPMNAFAAQGHWHQRIFVLPDQELVAVMTADDRDHSIDDNQWLPVAMALAESRGESATSPPASAPDGARLLGTLGGSGEDVFADVLADPAGLEAALESVEGVSVATPEQVTVALPEPPEGFVSTPPPETYDNALLMLATGFAAKEGCSCIFVTGRDEETCKAYLKVSPDVAKIRVDYEAKRVTSRALGMSPSRARWVSERDGCVLE